MPGFTQFLHYRKIDVSSFKEVVARLYPDIAAEIAAAKSYKHRGLEDIQESIIEFKSYQNLLFVPKNDIVTPTENKKPKI